MKKKVISYKNLPTRYPTSATVFAYILYDIGKLSDIVSGIVGTLLFVLWINAIYHSIQEEETDIFEDK